MLRSELLLSSFEAARYSLYERFQWLLRVLPQSISRTLANIRELGAKLDMPRPADRLTQTDSSALSLVVRSPDFIAGRGCVLLGDRRSK